MAMIASWFRQASLGTELFHALLAHDRGDAMSLFSARVVCPSQTRGRVLSRQGRAWLASVVVVVGVLLVAPRALAASPIPAFPKDGTVAVQDVPDSFAKLRRFLAEYRSPIGAKYHVAVVAYTDPLNRKGPGFGDESGEYLGRLVEKWRVSADTENAVIILLGLNNSDVRIHPFSRWARLGWRDYQVVKTLESSQFSSFARASDYESALRALVGAIDAELSRRLRDQENQEQRIRELVTQTQAKSWEYEALAKQWQYDSPRSRQLHERSVAGVASAQSALEAGELRKALELAQAAASDAEEAARLFAELRASELSSRDRLQGLRTYVAALEQSLVGADFDVTRVRSALKDATAELDEVDRLLREHQPQEAPARLSRAAVSINVAEDRITSAKAARDAQARERERQAREKERQARARVLFTWLGVALLGVILLSWLFVKRWRSAYRGRAARELIQQWETLLGRLADNLVKFEDEHALTLSQPGLMERFDETSTGPVLELAREVDNLYLSFEVAQRVLSAAKEELTRGGPLLWLRERPYERAIELLTVRQIVMRSEDLTQHKPYLPQRAEVQLQPQQLLAGMQASWERALHLMEKLEVQLGAAWEKLDQLEQELGELETLELRLVELGTPSSPRDEITKLGRKVQAARERMRSDPQGAVEEATRLVQSLSAVRKKTEYLVRVAAYVGKEVGEIRAEARAAVERLRAGGFTVEEPGFEPDAMLAHIDKRHAAAVKALKQGKTEAAEKRADEALESAWKLLELCERLGRSRQESLGRLAEAEERCRALRERTPERRERIRGLRRAHADSALQPALDNVEEASGALEQVARYLTEARACVTPQARRYLAVDELLSRASEQLDAVDALFQEIETKAEDLALARQEAEKELLAAWPFEDLQALLVDAPTANVETRAVYAEAKRVLSELRSAAKAERPDWLALRERVTALRGKTAATVERALAEYDAYQKAHKLQQELAAQRESAVKQLGSGGAEFEPSRVVLQMASAEFDETVALTKGPDVSWTRTLGALEQIAQRFESVSRPPAEKEPTRAERARKALAAADAALRHANRVYGAGVIAELNEARRCLAKALEGIAIRDYAAVFKAAEEVQLEVRKAINGANAEVARRERERQERAARAALPDISPAAFTQSPFTGPGRPSLGSSSEHSGVGKAKSRRRK
jgi:hypothetical protein